MLKFLATTRFNNETWKENQEFLKEHNNRQKNSANNNKIMGIGLVKNSPVCNKYSVYKNTAYNQFAYIGYYRIDRSDMNEMEETIMKVFDHYCFKGKTHLKRLKGIKIFPQRILDKCHSILDLLDFISKIFLSKEI